MNYCSKCGAELPDEAKFCTKCGNTIGQDNKVDQVKNEHKINKKAIYAFLAIIGVLLVIVFGSMFYSDYSEKREARLAREKFVADSLEQVRKELVDSPKFDSQKSNEAVKEEQIETISDDANSKMHNFGLHSKHHHHLTGTFEDSSGIYPIELDFNSSGRNVSDVIYKNVKLGGKIRMTCTYFDLSSITVKGKDGNNDFSISLNCTSRNSFRGTAIDGKKECVVVMEAYCQHE